MTDKIHILESRDGWIAVDKPCGISVHNDPGHDLVSILPGMIQPDSHSCSVHPAHRLDRETSGVILLAKDATTLQWLCGLFAEGKIKKQYTALVHGNFNGIPGSLCCGTWEFPLSKNAGGRNDPAGKPPRVACSTRYRVLQQSCHYTLLDIELVTGRKHQIRRHAKLSGHPVTGDTRYGSKKSVEFLKNTHAYNRLGLHCRTLEFVPPGHRQPIYITSKNPLKQMMRLLAEDGSQQTMPFDPAKKIGLEGNLLLK